MRSKASLPVEICGRTSYQPRNKTEAKQRIDSPEKVADEMAEVNAGRLSRKRPSEFRGRGVARSVFGSDFGWGFANSAELSTQDQDHDAVILVNLIGIGCARVTRI